MRQDGSSGAAELFAAAVAVGLIVAAGRQIDLPGLLAGAMGWVAARGGAGVGMYILLYVLACVFLVPGSVLTLGAGAVWGVAVGVPVVSVGSLPSIV